MIAIATTDRLEQIEAEFRHDEKAFLRRGALLKEVRDERLYRDMFATFEAYCEERLKVQRRHAYRLIDACETSELLCPIGTHQPDTERQIRPLTKLEPEQRASAWQAAVERGGGKPTGKVVAEVVREMLGEDAEPEAWDIIDALENLRERVEWCAKRWPKGAEAVLANQLRALADEAALLMVEFSCDL